MYKKQQQLIQQPWHPQYQKQKFQQYQPHHGLGQQSYGGFGQQQVYPGPGQQAYVGFGQCQVYPNAQ